MAKTQEDKTTLDARRQAIANEMARQRKADEDAKLHQAKLKVIIEKHDADKRKLASSLKCPSPQFQKEATYQMTVKTTEQLGAVLAYLAKTPKTNVLWLGVDAHAARDCMQRAYALALQLGHIAHLHERTSKLVLSNASSLEFTWPRDK